MTTPTIHLEARNVRGIREVSTPLDGITLVAGLNGSGKTSLAQALAAALTGTAPLPGLKKSDLHLVLRAGTAAGQAVVSTPAGRSAWGLPEGKVQSEGTPPQASPYAAGIVSVLDLPLKQATEAMARYIDANPTREDLAAALPDLDPDELAMLWRDIEAGGWDGAHANAKEDGARMKGKWEQVTGERYGLKKAASWLPPGWHPGLESESLDALTARVAETKAAYAIAIKAAAISGDARERLAALAALVDPRREAWKTSEAAYKAAAQAEDAADKALDESRFCGRPLSCPHCGAAVALDKASGALIASTYSQEEAAKHEAEHKALVAALAAATANTRQAHTALQDANRALHDSEDAAAQLAASPAPGDNAALEAAQAALDMAQYGLTAWQAYTAAMGHHAAIVRKAAIVTSLAPDGLRAVALARALTAWNASLAALCAAAGFPVVRMEHDLSTSYGDRPYALLSESEQYRTRAIVQAAQAATDGSALVVFDRADILDREGRNGLFRLALHLALPAVVCMTANLPGDVPDLAARGMGRTLWLEGGEAWK